MVNANGLVAQILSCPFIHTCLHRSVKALLLERMRASLIIYGPGARGGAKLPLARMIDLAPSIAVLLKLKLPHPEGKPFKELLDGGAPR
jgi:hypothetical protein